MGFGALDRNATPDRRNDGVSGGFEDGRIFRVRRRPGTRAGRSDRPALSESPREHLAPVFDRGRKMTLPIQWREAILFGQIVSI